MYIIEAMGYRVSDRFRYFVAKPSNISKVLHPPTFAYTQWPSPQDAYLRYDTTCTTGLPNVSVWIWLNLTLNTVIFKNHDLFVKCIIRFLRSAHHKNVSLKTKGIKVSKNLLKIQKKRCEQSCSSQRSLNFL
jgi:hypothetical protein